VGTVEHALDLLRAAGAAEVTVRFDLARAPVAPPAPGQCSRHPLCHLRPGHGGVCLDARGLDIDGTEPRPAARRVVDEALEAAADEFSHTGARVTRDVLPRDEEDADEDD